MQDVHVNTWVFNRARLLLLQADRGEQQSGHARWHGRWHVRGRYGAYRSYGANGSNDGPHDEATDDGPYGSNGPHDEADATGNGSTRAGHAWRYVWRTKAAKVLTTPGVIPAFAFIPTVLLCSLAAAWFLPAMC